MLVIRHYGVSILLTFVAVGIFVLEGRSYFAQDTWEFSTLEAHYTLRSYKGWMTIMGPPRGLSGAREREAWKDLKNLNNDQLRFRLGTSSMGTAAVSFSAVGGSPAEHLMTLPRAAVIRPLLRGLDGPKKFAASAVLLEMSLSRSGQAEIQTHVESHPDVVSCSGYQLHVLWKPSTANWQRWASSEFEVLNGGAMNPTVEPNFREVLRTQWHRRMDVLVARIAYPALVLPTLALPVFQMLRAWGRRRRRRSGCCAACGYDIRASRDVCPECGTPIEANTAGLYGRNEPNAASRSRAF